jgi:hypothetical protein
MKKLYGFGLQRLASFEQLNYIWSLSSSLSCKGAQNRSKPEKKQWFAFIYQKQYHFFIKNSIILISYAFGLPAQSFPIIK